ncbi:kappa-type opioid receptor-like [Gigantopelta aegis]|uniref:kappa-type opioid receptor-like n=1 Tax=Gigantopelta aegis TaxID=1735272 RepID=UPI001B888E9C|nr:kappa-type opioid receptor-like [Gigantopelta aegis]
MGVIGNALLFTMMRDKKLKSLSYSVYLKLLFISDSVLLSIKILQETERTFALRSLASINIGLCKILFGIKFLIMVLSPWLMVGLTLDRYVCVCFPLTREILCTRMKAIAVCLCILVLAVALTVPFLVEMKLVRGKCATSEGIRYYFIFTRLMFSSILPCLAILVLNILIIIHIHRSHNFRSMFMRSGNKSSSRKLDSSTSPLVLVSVLAFVTLLPASLAEAAEVSLIILKANVRAKALLSKFWAFFVLLYLLNFGQNFYILIASSSNYRNIIRDRLACYCLKRNRRNQQSS